MNLRHAHTPRTHPYPRPHTSTHALAPPRTTGLKVNTQAEERLKHTVSIHVCWCSHARCHPYPCPCPYSYIYSHFFHNLVLLLLSILNILSMSIINPSLFQLLFLYVALPILGFLLNSLLSLSHYVSCSSFTLSLNLFQFLPLSISTYIRSFQLDLIWIVNNKPTIIHRTSIRNGTHTHTHTHKDTCMQINTYTHKRTYTL